MSSDYPTSRIRLTYILLLAALLISCGDESSKTQFHNDEAHSVHLSDTAEQGLRLNNGQKWLMDDHTRSTFAEMAGSFLKTDYLSMEGEGLKKTGSNLQLQIGELIKGCTMTGDAHDQLHVYLMGYIPAVAALSESGRIEDAQKVKHYLEIFNKYFE
jgi:hypothetical protein